MRIAVRVSFLLLMLSALSAQAITYIVPSDRDLVKRAEGIVIATAVESHSEFRGERLVTVATLRVERTIKGDIPTTLQLVEIGGRVGDRITFIPGSPRYEDGKRYLVFLRTNPHGEWLTYGFGLGQFVMISDLRGHELVTRGNTDDEIFGLNEADGSLHVEQLRDAPGFLAFVEARAASDAPARETYFVNRADVLFGTFPEFKPRASAFVPRALTTRADYLFAGNYRWQSPSASFQWCCGSQNGGTGLDPASASSGAMAAWAGAGVGISYSLTGVDGRAQSAQTGLTNPNDGVNDILLNDRHHIIGSGGAVAVGGISNNGPPYSNLGDGITYIATTEVDVETGTISLRSSIRLFTPS